MKSTVFANGCRFIYEPSSNNIPLTSINIFCDVGSVHEPEHLRGVSHIIEHMCFKGTKKILTSKGIFIEYDKIGAYLNAHTTKRYTCYVIKCESHFVDKALQIVADMLLNSVFDKSEYDKEYSVVIEENTDNENDYEDVIIMMSDKSVYSGSSFEYPVDTLAYHDKKRKCGKMKCLDYDDVIEFYRKYYIPRNIIISVVSSLPYSSVKRTIEKTFFVKHQKLSIAHHFSQETAIISKVLPQEDIKFSLKEKEGVENILMTISFRICDNNSPDKYLILFINELLVSMSTSRFFMILREKYGLIYSPSSTIDNYDENGDITILIQTDKDKLIGTSTGNITTTGGAAAGGGSGHGHGLGHGHIVRKQKKYLIPVIVSLFNDIIKNGITQEELETTKGYIRGNTIIDMEDIDNQCNYNGYELLLQRNREHNHNHNHVQEIVPFHRIYDTFYKKISRKDVHDAIKKYFKRSNMSVCLLGKKLPSINLVKKEFDKFVG